MKSFSSNLSFRILVFTLFLAGMVACGGGGSSSGTTPPAPTAPVDLWTWMSGSDVISQAGTYGTQGVAADTNMPGARYGAAHWTDSSGNLWMFGGQGYDSVGTLGDLNDLWKYDGSNWTWVSGSDVAEQYGVYNGATAADNMPGARQDAASWIDSSGNLWLFGGLGRVTVGVGALNDLWKFDGGNWTWMGGSDITNQPGVYTSATAADNVPGARSAAISWTDSSGNLWLFGGSGYDSVGIPGNLNDLWKYDGSNWIWVSGSDVVDQNGVYGTKGTADAANVPGTRQFAVSWADSSDNMWLFGGIGFDTTGTLGILNDLWKFDGTNWTWVSGSNLVNQASVYGTQGVADAANVPGARYASVSWIDSSGNLWLFGGDTGDFSPFFNDLWKYDGANWIWIDGSGTANHAGDYGTKGVATDATVPGSRGYSASWIDSSDNMWLFGGGGYDSTGTLSFYLNDLWRYQP